MMAFLILSMQNGSSEPFALRDDEIFGAHCFSCLPYNLSMELTWREKGKGTSLCWGRGSDRVVVQLSFVPRI